jgi:hypothetical protein
MKNKRGISNLVSTVLLVTSAIAIAILIFVWISHTTGEKTEKSSDIGAAEKICKDIKIKIIEASMSSLEQNTIEFTVENQKNREITALRIRIESGDNVEVKKREGKIQNYETVSDTITTDISLIEGETKIKIIPEITLESPEIESTEAGWWLCSTNAAEAIV